MTTPSADRVASRYLTAGLLKPPPAMVADITEWVQTNTARWLATANVSDEVRNHAQKHGGSGRFEAQRTFQVNLKEWAYLRSFGKATDKALAAVAQHIENAEPTSSHQARKAITSMKGDPIVAEGLEDPYGDAGERATTAVIAKYPALDRYTVFEALTDISEGVLDEITSPKIPTPLFLRQLFPQTPNAGMTAGEVHDLIKKVDQMPPHQVAEAALAVLPEGFRAIDVSLLVGAGPGRVLGSWDGVQRKLLIHPSNFLKTYPDYEYPMLMRSISDTVAHELQHMTQDIIKVLAGLHEEGGLPSIQIRNRGYTPDGRRRDNRGNPNRGVPRDYLLRDAEFYPWLGNVVKVFNDRAERAQLNAHGVWDAARKAWVGASPPLKRWGPERLWPHLQPFEASPFFRHLRENEPRKWQKAVGEFWKATEPPKTPRTTQSTSDPAP